MKNGKYEQFNETTWYENNRLHREDGPAVEWSDGYKEWWIHGVEYTEEKFNLWRQNKLLNEFLLKELPLKSSKPQLKV